jgi:type III pantothenate kinase
MLLTIDLGNSQLYGGVYDDDKLILQFRKFNRQQYSSDEIGLFLNSVLRENKIKPEEIGEISICSVVPQANHAVVNGCRKYFNTEPFILQPGAKTGLKIKYKNPAEVGADRIINAIAGYNLFPNKNLIIVDFGTATTFCVITKEKEYLGGIILPGINISMEALERNAAKLPKVEIKEMNFVVGKTTQESIQSGLYYGQIGMIKEIKSRITKESFKNERPIVIGTGGFSSMFKNIGLFDEIIPTLVLQGLKYAIELNKK